LFLAAFVIWTVGVEIENYTFPGIISALRSIPARRIILAVFLTMLDYAIIASVDLLGLRWLGCRPPFSRAAFAAVTGNALWCNAGVIAGSSAKLRLYSNMGLSPVQIGSLITFTSGTYFLGLFFLGGILHLIFSLPEMEPLMSLPLHSSRIVSMICLVLVGVYLGFSLFHKKNILIANHEISFPEIKTALAQIALASTDWLLAGSILLVLLPPVEGQPPVSILAVYILAQMGVLVSQVPGGLGVLEGMLMILLPVSLKGDGEIAAILAFRIIFSIIPLLVSSLCFGIYEVWHRITPGLTEKEYNID
jgi:uncharacterized membrane protein YbhN (UPF0104 family)